MTPAEFELRIDTDGEQKLARLKLSRADGEYVASHDIRLPDHSSALWEGLFDTRRYIDCYEGAMLFDDQVAPATAALLLRRLGRFLGEQVMGADIVRALSGPGRRVLVVRVPTSDKDVLAAAFARVPWEIACLDDDTRPRNLVVRAVTQDSVQGEAEAGVATQAATNRVGDGETLRVLAVFAEAPGARPLAMRSEREDLLKLFADKILPHHQVEIDILCHGVTRRRIIDAISARDGYHIVHWSGHGHHNALELQGEPGDSISGESLVALFAEAGGFIPQVFFLSACHSGALLQVKDWHDLRRVLERDDSGQGSAAKTAMAARPDDSDAAAVSAAAKQLEDAYQDPSGYTGTALALLHSGVPQVVAMRYAVGDEYARRLAVAFYQRLLADHAPRATDEALAMARNDVARGREQGAYHAVDHATPLMFGRPGVLLAPAPGRGRQMDRLRPRPQPLLVSASHELDPAAVFVGRGDALARLSRDWLAADGPAVALIQGLAGLGKTALAAEAIHLWHPGFDFVLAFQAKPRALPFDELCRQLDQRLSLESPRYRERCQQNALDHIYLGRDAALFPDRGARGGRMRANLVEALRDEAILLLIDNFETNLETVEREAGTAVYACAAPAWDALLDTLARELPATRSRLLITSRRRPRALASGLAHGAARQPAPAASEPGTGPLSTLWISLGPLPMGEAALFVRSHPRLRRLLFDGSDQDRALIQRLLRVSRGHPLILDRFARLVGEPPAAPGSSPDPTALAAALDHLDQGGWRQLPDLFVGAGDDAQREAERRYLEDLAIGSVDLLIDRLTPDARRLLRVVTLANEPVGEAILDGVWQGKTLENEQLDKLAGMIGSLKQMPDDDPRRQKLAALFATDEGKAILERLQAPRPAEEAPPSAPLLAELRSAGLLTREASAGGQASYAFHELVRERMAQWSRTHAGPGAARSDDGIRIAYGERYAALFKGLYHQDRDAAGEAGRRALVYFVAARAFERLDTFASYLVTGVNDPALLRGVVAELQGVIDQALAGEARWSLRTYVADALRNGGQADRALVFYQDAAGEAEAAGDWSDVAWITGNWANAVRDVGDLDEVKALRLRSADAERRAGSPEVLVIAHELEALRVDVMRGDAETALSEVDARLDRVRAWWRRDQAGDTVPEAPDRASLGRVLVAGIDIAESANQRLEHWQACLDLLDEQASVQQALGEDPFALARTRFNRYGPLLRLDRLDEAQQVLEACLAVFRSAGAVAAEASCLSGLADLWDERGEAGDAIALERQALAVRDTLPDPSDRATSHDNLGNYLGKDGRDAEAADHHAAGLAYALCIGSGTQVGIHNLGIRARRALAAGTRYTLPRLSAILAKPGFAALQGYLAGRSVDLEALQAEIDRLVGEAHEQVSGSQLPFPPIQAPRPPSR